MNTVNLFGRMTDKAVIRNANDKKVANFTVAVNGMKDHTDFIRCVAFGNTAAYLEKFGDKGTQISVVGHIHTDSYEKDGQRIYTTEVYVSNLELVKTNKVSVQEVEVQDEDLPF